MLKFDFAKINDIDNFNKYMDKKDSVIDQFKKSNMIGWTKDIDKNLVNRMINVSDSIKKHSDCLVVIGIGGSFLGSYAVDKMFSSYFNSLKFPVIYAGNNVSSKYLNDLLGYLDDVDFSLNVISKSGTTMETTITYKLIKELMMKKYDSKELKKRIIITTDKVNGSLRSEAHDNSYESFVIPNDIGGRYSFLTPAHLFPLAFNYDIKSFISGYKDGHKYLDDAYLYAVTRRCLFDNNKFVENFCVFEPCMYYFTEWVKQLFGETEGKNGMGILPTSCVYTRDLHSLGQFIQDGNKILFETYLNAPSEVSVSDELDNINSIVLDSVRKAHLDGGVYSNVISMEEYNYETCGELIYFLMMSAAFSAYLFSVNPFDQPGVEAYKKEIKSNL